MSAPVKHSTDERGDPTILPGEQPVCGCDEDRATDPIDPIDQPTREQLQHMISALSDRLRAAEMLGHRGLVAASIGHELNNALTAVLGNLECLDAELSELESPALINARELVTDALDASRGAAALARDLHTGLTPGNKQASIIDLRDVVRQTVRMARPKLRRRATLRESYAADVPMIFANPRAISQIVLNLLLNAEEALPTESDVAANSVSVELGVDSKGRAVLSISDSGRGMDEETASHIFEAFFTSRDAGGGTGLGLYLTQQLVADAGGMIEVESEPGRGTVLFITFPNVALTTPRSDAVFRQLPADDESKA